MEDEVTLTDDEARDIIALADKLRAAMGEEEMEGAMDAMDDAEDEMDDAMDAMDAAMDDEPGMGKYRMEEELFEAALKGLDIEIVEDKKVQLENLSKEIYKKVVARLLQESKK
jgi:gamma-glutamyl:cysteine ligase YbdK (ATP-grasp superfamily)